MIKPYVYVYGRICLTTRVAQFVVKVDLFSGEVKEDGLFPTFDDAEQHVLSRYPHHVRVNPDFLPDFGNRMPDFERCLNCWESILMAAYVPSDSRHARACTDQHSS